MAAAKPLSFDAQLDPAQAEVFGRACGLLGVPATDSSAAAIAREALIEWCEWLDARAQFPTISEQRRYRVAKLFGRIVPALKPGVPSPEQVRKVLPLLPVRQIAKLIAEIADSADPLYLKVTGARLKDAIDDALAKAGSKQVVSVWVDVALAPLLQERLDDAFKTGGLQQQIKGVTAGDAVKFAAIDATVAQAIAKKLG